MKQILLLLSLVLVLGCVGTPTNNTVINTTNITVNMTSLVAAAGDHVFVDYTGRYENGTVFDSSVGKQPIEFDVGAGQMIPGFDSAVIGMHISEEKTVTLPPELAYGPVDPKNIVVVNISLVPEGTKVGDTLYAGSRPVIVLAVNNNTVTIDANHPLAGKTLVFDIKMVDLRKNATATQ
jgi:FKBP-type peptidyl-prolyl cis-trans isomerase 2